MHEILDQEGAAGSGDLYRITALDFAFHHAIGMTLGNLIFSLCSSAFKPQLYEFHRCLFSRERSLTSQ